MLLLRLSQHVHSVLLHQGQRKTPRTRVEQLLGFSNRVTALGDNLTYLVSAENKLIATYEVETYSDCPKMA